MKTTKELAQRVEDSFLWWTHHRDQPSDLEKQLVVQKKAINDLYALHSHILEVLAHLEGLPPGSLGRRLYLPTGMAYQGDLSKFG